MDSKRYALSQSRPRAYGLFAKVAGHGPAGRAQSLAKVSQFWEFMLRCQARPARTENLAQILKDSSDSAEMPLAKRRRSTPARRGGQKWKDRHSEFREACQLTVEDTQTAELQDLRRKLTELALTEREVEAAVLELARLKRARGIEFAACAALAGNIGDNIGYLKFSALHPCLLPEKKYLYLLEGEPRVIKSTALALRLQGIGPVEARFSGLDACNLTPERAQDLAGNAFSANVVVAALLGVLLTLR